MKQILESVSHESIQKLKADDNVSVSNFADIALEQSADLTKIIAQIKRGFGTMSDKDELVEKIAGSILATTYLVDVLGLTEKVSQAITNIHNTNCRSAERQCFLRCRSFRDFSVVQDVLKHEISEANGQIPKVACILDDNYCIVVELHIAYNLVYLQQYKHCLLDEICCELDIVDTLFGTTYFSEACYDLEDSFHDALKKVYENYRNAIQL